MHLWLLAPDSVDRAAHGALDGGRNGIGIAPLAGRQALEGLEDRFVNQRVDRRALARTLGETRYHHVRIASHLPPGRERQRDRDDAGVSGAGGAGRRIPDPPATESRPSFSRRPLSEPHPLRRLPRPGASRIEVAIEGAQDRAARPAPLANVGMLGQMQRLAVRGHGDLWDGPSRTSSPSPPGADGRRRAPARCGR